MAEVEIRRIDAVTTVTPRENLTLSIAEELRPRLLQDLAEGVSQVVFDLRGTEVVDSSGIGLLIATHNSLNKTGGSLEVVGVSPEIMNLFKAMRLDRHFSVAGR